MRIRDADLRSEDIWRRIQTAIGAYVKDELKPVDVKAIQLDKYELSYLHNYVRRHISPAAERPSYPWDAPARPFYLHDRVHSDAFFDILTAPIDRSTRQGRDRERIRQVLGLSTRVDSMVSRATVNAYGGDLLANAAVFLNGHATSQTFAFFPMLAALGLRDGAYKASNYSGNIGLPALLQATLRRSMNDASAAVELESADAYIQRLESSDKNPIICINAGPLLTGKPLSDKLLKRIADGEIRFILHNQADIEAMRTLPVKAVIIDLAMSPAKVLEAQVIGEQWAVLASENCLRHCDTPLRNGITIVKGYGILGKSVVNGLAAFGYDKDQTYIIETDPERADMARAAGYKHVYSSIPEECRYAKAAAVIVATNRTGFDASDVENLPLKSTVMALTSGGQGIDVASVSAHFGTESYSYRKTGVGGGMTENSVFTDVTLGSYSEHSRRLTIVNCRKDGPAWRTYPLNLVKPVGQQRLVTSAMLTLAVAQAASTSEVGVHAIAPESMQILSEALDKYRPKGRDRSLINALSLEGMRAAIDGLASIGPHEPDDRLLKRAQLELARDGSFARSLRIQG